MGAAPYPSSHKLVSSAGISHTNRVRFLLPLLLVVGFVHPAWASDPYVWAPDQRTIADDWLRAVGKRKPNESLGELAVRAGKLRLGTPYLDPAQLDVPEELHIELATLQCQSFVESSLAIARCVWNETPTADCMASEVRDLRYRDGVVAGFASRLHYFNDWLTDNARRGSLVLLGDKVATKAWTQRFDYMSKHHKRYPQLAHADILEAISAAESRLTSTEYRIVPKEQIAAAEKELQTGDVIAFITSQKPGLMISHTGFVVRGASGALHVMHASSYHQKVIITRTDLAGYLNARDDRQGIMVARPQPPLAPQRAAAEPVSTPTANAKR